MANEEESAFVLNKFIDFLMFYNTEIKYSFKQFITIIEAISNNNLSKEYVMNLLFEKQLFKKCPISKGDFSSYIDGILSNGVFENPETMIKMISEQIPEYCNYPLLIMNQNLTKEAKIKAIKLTYRQKDFPKYKSYIREKITNLNDLDVFIEATITQNNRVREKEANIQKLFKDIFVSGDYSLRRRFSSTNSFQGVKEFTEKYRKYFMDPKFVHQFYREAVSGFSTNESVRNTQYESFIQLMFMDATTEEVLTALKGSPELKLLGTNLPQLMYSAENNGNEELATRIASIMASWAATKLSNLTSMLDSERKDLGHILLKYKDNEEIINNICENSYFFSYSEADMPNYAFCQNYSAFFTTSEIINKTKVFEYQNDIKYFGLNYSKVAERLKCRNQSYLYSSNSTLSIFRDKISKFYEELFNSITSIADIEILKVLVEKFYAPFENPDNANDFASNAIEFFNNPDLKEIKSYYSASSSFIVIDYFKNNMKRMKETAEVVYSELAKVNPIYNERKANFDAAVMDAANTIELLCNITI